MSVVIHSSIVVHHWLQQFLHYVMHWINLDARNLSQISCRQLMRHWTNGVMVQDHIRSQMLRMIQYSIQFGRKRYSSIISVRIRLTSMLTKSAGGVLSRTSMKNVCQMKCTSQDLSRDVMKPSLKKRAEIKARRWDSSLSAQHIEHMKQQCSLVFMNLACRTSKTVIQL